MISRVAFPFLCLLSGVDDRFLMEIELDLLLSVQFYESPLVPVTVTVTRKGQEVKVKRSANGVLSLQTELEASYNFSPVAK